MNMIFIPLHIGQHEIITSLDEARKAIKTFNMIENYLYTVPKDIVNQYNFPEYCLEISMELYKYNVYVMLLSKFVAHYKTSGFTFAEFCENLGYCK